MKDVKPRGKGNKAYSVLSIGERASIEAGLKDGKKPAAIAAGLGRSVSTVTRELKSHSVKVKSDKNHCLMKLQGLCKRRGVCGGSCGSKLCHRCRMKKCWERCSDYVPAYCDRLDEPPHLCNGCPDVGKCPYDKVLYDLKKADDKASEERHGKAKGFDYTDAELDFIDGLISPMIKNGMSPYAALIAAGPELKNKGIKLSKSTLYRLIGANALTSRNIDLPERVSRRTRKRNHNKDTGSVPTVDKAGRLWEDYQKFIGTHNVIVPQMDCVEGRKSGKAVLLTLYWPDTHIQVAFIMDAQDSRNVVKTLDELEMILELDMFREMLPAILTDNGHEFTDIEGMERSCTVPGEKRTRIFFCDPNRSDQKGGCERNHREMRRVIPKGRTDLDIYMQADINLMMNHVNSYPRESLHGRTPYELAKVMYGNDFLQSLAIERIPPDRVILSPKLLQAK